MHKQCERINKYCSSTLIRDNTTKDKSDLETNFDLSKTAKESCYSLLNLQEGWYGRQLFARNAPLLPSKIELFLFDFNVPFKLC